MLTPNELGVRLLETFASGVCYSVWALVVLYILTRSGVRSRIKLFVGLLCFAAMAAGSFITHHGLFVHRTLDVAWGNLTAIVAKATLTVMVLSGAPEMAQAWIMYHKAKELTKSNLDCYHLDVKVRRSFFRRPTRTSV